MGFRFQEDKGDECWSIPPTKYSYKTWTVFHEANIRTCQKVKTRDQCGQGVQNPIGTWRGQWIRHRERLPLTSEQQHTQQTCEQQLLCSSPKPQRTNIVAPVPPTLARAERRVKALRLTRPNPCVNRDPEKASEKSGLTPQSRRKLFCC